MRGFTLVELLVVFSIIALLLSIMAPAVSRSLRKARDVQSISNQKHITAAVNLYSGDNRDRYPESVATIGSQSSYWNWQEPMMMTAYRARSGRYSRSVSDYLLDYIPNSDVMYCPNAPSRYKYLDDAWQAGDDWDNPETAPRRDPLTGIYCFWWNYTGCVMNFDAVKPLTGPGSMVKRRGRSTVVVSDYLGFDHWRNPGKFSSCEKFRNAGVIDGTQVSSSFWGRPDNVSIANLEIKVTAGYVDGHVESSSPGKLTPLRVALDSGGTVPYPDGVGPGYIFLPGLR